MCVSLVGTRKRVRRRYMDGSGFEMCPMKDLRITRCRVPCSFIGAQPFHCVLCHAIYTSSIPRYTPSLWDTSLTGLCHSANTVCATLPTQFVPLCRQSLSHSADTVCATLPTQFEPLCRHSSPLSGFLTPGHGVLRKRPADRKRSCEYKNSE